jgi:hypothetical protein
MKFTKEQINSALKTVRRESDPDSPEGAAALLLAEAFEDLRETVRPQASHEHTTGRA